MGDDILYKDKDFVFSYRVGGILIHDGRILLQKPLNDDYSIIGGHVAAMETTEETLKREFEEELHADVVVGELMAVGEIFFPWGSRPCHQISLYYRVELTDPTEIPLSGGFFGYDDLDNQRIDLEYCWVPLEQLTQIVVYPQELIPHILSDMTSVVLEEISELFDLSIKPGPVDMAQVEQLLAKARADYEAEQATKIAAQIEKHESKYVEGYQEYVNYRLETAYRPERMSYLLYDVNSDGTDELIIQSSTILSMKDGTSYKYFDINEVKIAGATFYPCEGNTFELCHELFAMHQYYFYRAEAEGASFITGVIHDTNEDIWYRSLSGGSYDEKIEQISAEEAQKIRDSYTRVEIDMLPLQKYGQEVTSVNYKHPYSKYIAGKLDRYEEAPNYQYALLDVNGDGIEELITRDYEIQTTDQTFYLLQIYSIKDGKLWDMGMDYFTYVCEGGILENTENFDDSAYHYFYRCTENGVEPIEKIVRDPITLYWGHALAGQDGKTVTEEKAKSILNSYKRLELDWKPFAEYPLS